LPQRLASHVRTAQIACSSPFGGERRRMVTALMTTFLEAKMKDANASVALYAVTSDVEGAKIAQETANRSTKAVAGMLKSTRDRLTTDPHLVASMIQGVMVGVSRSLLESDAAQKQYDLLRRETILLACAYVNACS